MYWFLKTHHPRQLIETSAALPDEAKPGAWAAGLHGGRHDHPAPATMGTMMTPEDHERAAMGDLEQDKPQDAMVSAVLALAAAVTRLAEAHESVANSMIDLTPARARKWGR
jgi:hypothetical protein